jgi:DNA-binding MarR family transcriptional regulator
MTGPDHEDADRTYAQLLRFRRELRGFLRWSEEAARANGLTPSVHQLLLAVRGSERAGGPTVKDVAEALDVRHHTAVELAQRAEETGLLLRERSDPDQRQVRLTLTDAGRLRLDEVTRLHRPRIAALAEVLSEVTADLPPEA